MIHRWPSSIKPFYMKRDKQNNDLALGFDMLAPEGFGEIIGGGQREEDVRQPEPTLTPSRTHAPHCSDCLTNL